MNSDETQRAPDLPEQIWDMKYRLKRPDGTPVDATRADTWRRVAGALAAPEAEPQAWAPRFFEAMAAHRFLPAGRIIAGAGTERDVTLFNCFVMGQIPDSMDGIFEHLKEAALTLQQGGGIGYDFSTLRPRGALVRGVGADASGPVSFMEVWDAMCRTIMSAGYRRGAMMGVLRCDHPDVEDFVDAKAEAGRLTNFNMSVLATDAFMAAVEADADWPLVFAGETYRTVRARDLWDRIMRATYETSEPGVIFIDRINALDPLNYCEDIRATNPCVTADTWVATAEGPRQVGELVGRETTLLVDGQPVLSGAEGFFRTGEKPCVRIETREGPSLRLTADHRVRRVARRNRYTLECEWTPAGALRPGDAVVLHDHRAAPEWPGVYGEREGYLIGLLLGDGTLKSDKAVLCAWPGRAVCGGGYERPGAAAVMNAAMRAAEALPRRSDFRGWMAVPGRGEFRMAMGGLKALAEGLGMAPGAKRITADIERQSSAFYGGMLRGLFDADGTVAGTQAKGVSVRLAQSDLDNLGAVQRMLLRLGIVSTLHRNRRPAGTSLLPDGKGGRAAYTVRAQHEIVVSGANLALFAERVGFADTDKAARLRTAFAGYRRALDRPRFFARVASVEPDGEAEVFDVQVPGANAFDANGFYVHNCGEQPLPPYGACLLGSLNLAELVVRPFEADAHLDLAALDDLASTAVRALDNAIEVSRFPLEAQRREAEAKRRIGLGVTGLGDALIMLGLTYGSREAVDATRAWMARLQRAAYLASADLAAEKGSFPLFDRDAYLATEGAQRLPDEVRAAIAEKGLRNGLLTSVAPTGTISILADNVSSGLEPVFAFEYERTVLMPDGSRRAQTVTDLALRRFRALKGPEAPLPPAFVDAQRLEPGAHLVMQAAVQAHVDSSVSKTINLPEDIGFEAFKDVYRRAYDLGCKGCTTYRPSPVRGAVLATARQTQEPEPTAEAAPPPGPVPAPAPAPDTAPETGSSVVYMTRPLDRPEALPGRTYKLTWPESDHAMYITLNDVVQDGRRRPFEIFINSKNMEHYAWTVALTRMISAVFRRGGDVSFVVEELKAVFDPRGGAWMKGRYVPSLLAAIGEVIEEHMTAIGFLPERAGLAKPLRQAAAAQGNRGGKAEGDGETLQKVSQCPKCGGLGLIHQEGCDLCTQCGYSRCG